MLVYLKNFTLQVTCHELGTHVMRGLSTCLLKWVTKIQQAPYKPMEHHPLICILLIIKLNTVLKAMLILLNQFLSFKTGRINASV